jgi:hypothetical protein
VSNSWDHDIPNIHGKIKMLQTPNHQADKDFSIAILEKNGFSLKIPGRISMPKSHPTFSELDTDSTSLAGTHVLCG